MWLSCSAFFHQYYRVYSPIAFPKKYSGAADYVRRFVPVLKKFPEKFIFEPWTAPLEGLNLYLSNLLVQKAAGCIIGKDYPSPIVEHAEESKKNIERMKNAYQSGKEEKESAKSPKSEAMKRKSSKKEKTDVKRKK